MKKYIFVSMVTMGFLISCETVAQNPFPANQEVAIQSQKPQFNTVNIIDRNLQRTYTYQNGKSVTSGKLAIENAGQTILKSGLPEVWVQIRNLTDYNQNISVRTTWFDKTGRPVDGPSAWSRLFLSQNAGETYMSASVSPQAAAFMVEVQEAR